MRSSTRILDLGREKHIIARPAQPRSAASQAGSDPIDVRNVGTAEAKNVRCAGLSLLVRPLSDRRRFSVEQERKRCDPAGDWMLWPHTGAFGKNCFHRSSKSFLPAKMSNSRLLSLVTAPTYQHPRSAAVIRCSEPNLWGDLPARSRRASMAHARHCKQAQPSRTFAGSIPGEKQ